MCWLMSPWKQGACPKCPLFCLSFCVNWCAVCSPGRKRWIQLMFFILLGSSFCSWKVPGINKQTVGYGHQLLSHSDTFDLVLPHGLELIYIKPAVCSLTMITIMLPTSQSPNLTKWQSYKKKCLEYGANMCIRDWLCWQQKPTWYPLIQ